MRGIVASSDLAAQRAQHGAARDFAVLARCLALSPAGVATAMRLAEDDPNVPDRVKAVLKSAVTAGSTTNLSSLVGYAELATAFMESVAPFSAFDRLLTGGAMRLPPSVRISAVTAMITGAGPTEASAKPLSSLSLEAGADVNIRKGVAIVAVSRELLELGGDVGLNFLGRELRKAAGRATNSAFLPLLAAEAGATVASVDRPLEDLRAGLEGLEVGETSRVFWVMGGENVKRLAATSTMDGAPAFPQLSITGGQIIPGVEVVPSPDIASSEGLLIDATRLALTSDDFTLRRYAEATIQMDDAPDSPPSASTSVISLWQENKAALIAERWWALDYAASDAVVKFTGINYGSPDSPSHA